MLNQYMEVTPHLFSACRISTKNRKHVGIDGYGRISAPDSGFFDMLEALLHYCLFNVMYENEKETQDFTSIVPTT